MWVGCRHNNVALLGALSLTFGNLENFTIVVRNGTAVDAYMWIEILRRRLVRTGRGIYLSA